MTQFDKILGFYHGNKITTLEEWAEASIRLMQSVPKTDNPIKLRSKYISYLSTYHMACMRILSQVADEKAVVSHSDSKGTAEIAIPNVDTLSFTTALDFSLHTLQLLVKTAVQAQKRLWREEHKAGGLTPKQAREIGLKVKDSRHLYNSFYHQALEALVNYLRNQK